MLKTPLEKLLSSKYRMSKLKRVRNHYLRITPNNKLQVILKGGHVDEPLRLRNGSIVYDKPELIPDYIKYEVTKQFDAALEFGQEKLLNDYMETK